jgi:hypothetical protein
LSEGFFDGAAFVRIIRRGAIAVVRLHEQHLRADPRELHQTGVAQLTTIEPDGI